MKVLILSHSSGSENLGGAEHTLLQLIDAWQVRQPGIELVVVARNPPGLMQPQLDARGVVHESLDFSSWVRPHEDLGLVDTALALRMDSWAMQRIVSIIEEVKPDLVVTNTIVSPWAALAARLCGVPHAWLLHEFGDLDHGLEFRLGRDATLSDLNLLSDLVVANSLAVRDHVAPWIDKEILTITYPTIDLERVRRLALDGVADPAIERIDGALKAVMVGRVSASKGQWRLIRAVAMLRDEGLNVDVTLVGLATEKDEHTVRALIDELHLTDRVHLVGEMANPFPYVVQADIAVMASDCEAFGRVTVEYMALGRPVIASATGANPELVIDGETGWLFDPDDPRALAERIREAALDREEVSRRGLHAQRHVDEHLAIAFPVTELLGRLERASEQAPRPMAALPTITREWIDFPRAVESYLRSMHASRQVGHASLEWRVGRLLTAPARVIARALRGRS